MVALHGQIHFENFKVLKNLTTDWRERIKLEDDTDLPAISLLAVNIINPQKYTEVGKCLECEKEVKPYKTIFQGKNISCLPSRCNDCVIEAERNKEKEDLQEKFRAREGYCCGYQNKPAIHQGKIITWSDFKDGFEWQKRAINVIMDCIDGKTQGAYIYGKPGTGKTFMAKILHNTLLEEGRDSCYVRAVDLAIALRKETFSDNYKQVLNQFSRVPVLIIDDIGTQKNTEWVAETMYSIIDDRYVNNKTTFFTSNLNIHELGQDRLQSRMSDQSWCKSIELFGNDVRFNQK